jgi:hypothetical protein
VERKVDGADVNDEEIITSRERENRNRPNGKLIIFPLLSS